MQKWGYDLKNLIIDETWDDFEALSSNPHHYETTHFYESSQKFPQHSFGPKQFNGYKYEIPNYKDASDRIDISDVPQTSILISNPESSNQAK